AINVSHPFGLKIWKPALYKKDRSINAITYSDLHSVPGRPKENTSTVFFPGNIIWVFLFGWWMALSYVAVAILIIAPISFVGRVLLNLSGYIFWPFGKFIAKRRIHVSLYNPKLPGGADDQDAEGNLRNDEIYNSETTPLLSSDIHTPIEVHVSIDAPLQSFLERQDANIPESENLTSWQRRIKRIKSGGFAGFVFSVVMFFTLTPLHLVVTGCCFFAVVSVPMAKLNYVLLRHLMRHPLRLSAHSPEEHWANNWEFETSDYLIVLCTYNAIGLKYYKYTVDGVNIMFINLMAVVIFTLFDFYYLGPLLNHKGIGSYTVIFCCALLSVIPLSYFIGMAVSSITAETGSLALGAVINATFGSIVEVILYCLALMEGKTRMVEGAIVGSYMAGLLALPGVSMFFGGLKKKEQKFNSKAATVTSTMLIMSVIGVFGPTLFQEVYGTFELQCLECPVHTSDSSLSPIQAALSCKSCRYHQPAPTLDPIYQRYTRPLMYGSATALVLVYGIGLWFTLRTHAKRIYKTKKKHRRPTSTSSHRDGGHGGHGGHDNPNWNSTKSTIVLLGATVMFSLIAEVLIDAVDHVLPTGNTGGEGGWAIDEKFLGLTLFAIVPTVTEFYNAIAFAQQGNIALSLEIGSAYTIQVALLQIPILVAFSAYWRIFGGDAFSLVFPRWDLVAVLFSVFTVTYLYIEGKSNYFKGAMLLLAYFVLMLAFFCSPPSMSSDT
ncbi:hypothetical protein BC829DRAFT_365347, partial [Chytridium lagenaria]